MLGQISTGSERTQALGASGVLSVRTGGLSLRRTGGVDGELLLSEPGRRAAERRIPLGQSLSEIRALRAVDSALADVASHLERMRSRASPEGGLPEGAEREALDQRLTDLKTAIDALAKKHLDGATILPSSAMPSVDEIAEELTAAATRALLAGSSVEEVGGAVDRLVSSVVAAASSSLRVGSAFDANEVTALDVSRAAADTTFVLTADSTTFVAQNVASSTVVTGAVFAGQTVTAVDVSAAGADRTFTLKRTGLNRLKMTDSVTGASQTLDLSLLQAAGEKRLNYDQLGVSITLTGDAVIADTLAQALDNQTVVTTTVTDYTALRLTNSATGASQAIAFDALATSSGPKVVDFFEMGVSFTLDGPAESSTDALIQALHNATIVTETQQVLAEGEAFIDQREDEPLDVVSGPEAATEAPDDLDALTAAIAEALADISQRREATRAEIERLRAGGVLDRSGAFALAQRLLQDASLLPAAHSRVDREVVEALLAAEAPA
jgi:hypothetical protein